MLRTLLRLADQNAENVVTHVSNLFIPGMFQDYVSLTGRILIRKMFIRVVTLLRMVIPAFYKTKWQNIWENKPIRSKMTNLVSGHS